MSSTFFPGLGGFRSGPVRPGAGRDANRWVLRDRRLLPARSAGPTAGARQFDRAADCRADRAGDPGAGGLTMKLRVISLGAGVQSTTMALLAAHGEIGPMPDC